MQLQGEVFVFKSIGGRFEIQRIKLDAALLPSLWEVNKRGGISVFRPSPLTPLPEGRGEGSIVIRTQVNNLRYSRIDCFLKLAGRKRIVDQSPFGRALALQSFGERGKDIRAIAPHFAFIDQTRESARAGQDAEQRN